MQNRNTLISWIILIALAIVWGSSFILIKKSLLYFTASEVGLLRITITFLFLLPIALKNISKVNKKHKYYLVIAGVIGSFIPSFMFAIAQTEINSSLTGILNSLTPLFTLLLGLFFFKLKVNRYNMLGIVLGLIGALGLIYASAGGKGFIINIKYSSLIMIATICYAFNVNFIKSYLKEVDSLTITSLTFFYVGLPTLLYVLIFSDIPTKIINEDKVLIGMGYVSTLAILGTGIALIAFNKLIKISSPIFASSVTYMIPVIAIIWGIIDNEIFKLIYIFWFLILILGVLLVNLKTVNLQKMTRGEKAIGIK
ncbi:MAG: DMT family transporter [Bacteroidales bacterium]|jgi:drug/metabolite transporter (DMT)-like permease|nr:DMT family transporter [Bacteroidales bacterium]MDG2081157.1 DMT family transporter [Bacteroidales bacterium]